LTKFFESVKSKLEGPTEHIKIYALGKRKIGYIVFRPWPFFTGLLFLICEFSVENPQITLLSSLPESLSRADGKFLPATGKNLKLFHYLIFKKPCQ